MNLYIKRVYLRYIWGGEIGHPWPREGSQSQRKADENYNVIHQRLMVWEILIAKDP